jgi:hypothetical protein
MPTAANYWEHAQVDPGNRFTDAFPVDEPDPGDLNYRYELRATKALYGCAGRELARGDRIAGMAASQAEVVHEGVKYDVEVDTTHAEAIDCARTIAHHVK